MAATTEQPNQPNIWGDALPPAQPKPPASKPAAKVSGLNGFDLASVTWPDGSMPLYNQAVREEGNGEMLALKQLTVTEGLLVAQCVRYTEKDLWQAEWSAHRFARLVVVSEKELSNE